MPLANISPAGINYDKKLDFGNYPWMRQQSLKYRFSILGEYGNHLPNCDLFI